VGGVADRVTYTDNGGSAVNGVTLVFASCQ
jgi:hypothetical protein